MPKPWKVTYHAYTGRQEIMQIAELYQALAAQVGIEVELLTGEWPVLWKKQTKQESAANMFAVLWWADWPTPSGWLETMFRSEDPIVFNFSHYSNPEYDAVLDEALRLQGSDQAMAVEKFMEAQRIAYDDAVAMCLVDLQKTILHRADLGGVGYNAAYEGASWSSGCESNWRRWGWGRSTCGAFPTSSRAGSASALPSPGRSRWSRSCSSSTSRPPPSTSPCRRRC